MQHLVDRISGLVEGHPLVVLVVLTVVTVVLGGAATQLEVETDIAEYGGDAPISAAFDQVDEVFGIRGGGLQIVVDAGRGGDVLSGPGLAVGERLEELVEDELGDRYLAEPAPGQPAVMSYSMIVTAASEGLDVDTADLEDPFIAEVLQQALDQEGDELRALFSGDLDVDQPSARGGLVSVQFDPGLDPQDREDAGIAVRDRIHTEDLGFIDAEPFSFEVLSLELEEALFAELPLLLAVSAGLILLLLWWLFRSVTDVLLVLTGLVIVQVWFAGLAAVLGPEVLGWTGPFSQVAIAVPVMLLGLGVDYAVHLVARAREERRDGWAAPAASGRAVRTVGVALMLVTITTMVGFLSNVRSPLPPITDLGIFTAAGMFAAFVVLTTYVPTVRHLVDRRRQLPVDPPGGDEESLFGRSMGRAAGFAVSMPKAIIAGGGIVALLGTLAATDLDTEFSQEDFIPEGTTVDVLLDRMDDLFGGDVTEETFLLVEGDLTDPAVLDAIAQVEGDVADLDEVQTVEGEVEVTSPRSLVAQLYEGGQRGREQVVEQAQVAVGDAPADLLVPLPEELNPDQLPDDLADETDDGLGDAEAGPGADALDEQALEDRLPPGVDTDEALAQLLDPSEVADLLAEGAEEEVREDLLDTLGQDTAEALAGMDPTEVSLGTLEAVGFPMDELDDDTVELLSLAEDLEALGWPADGFSHQDGRGAQDLADQLDLAGVYDRVEQAAGDTLAQVLTDDRDAALVTIPTEAGEDGAEELAAELREVAEPLAAQVASVTVVSEQLVIEETLALLVDTQLETILFTVCAALALLVLYYLFSQRRPMLGVITMVPTALAIPIVLGTMWLIGLPFNALTATIASVAVGFGVDYGIHLATRFAEERAGAGAPEQAVRRTVAHTGAALVGSAATTSAAFGALMLSDLAPVAQFGGITALTMVVALVTTVLAQSSCLLLWERHHRRKEGRDEDGGRQASKANATAGAS